jgi:FemAB-related protein (PEP-CTERM system-associated)
MILPLPFNDANLESALGAKLRAQCKKAAMHDPEVTFGGLELLDQFYYVFSTNMRDLGTPVYSKKFFEKILQEKKISSFICIVKVKNKPVSAAFLTGYRDMLEIPWASTLRAANKYDSNMWMYRMILKRAIELEYRFFDFGRSTKYSNTYKFKKQWGAKPVDHHWYYLIDSDSMPEINTDNPKYRIFIAIWKRLPVWIANIIGPYIVKRIP